MTTPASPVRLPGFDYRRVDSNTRLTFAERHCPPAISCPKKRRISSLTRSAISSTRAIRAR
jgi:hypothetical protein